MHYRTQTVRTVKTVRKSGSFFCQSESRKGDQIYGEEKQEKYEGSRTKRLQVP